MPRSPPAWESSSDVEDGSASSSATFIETATGWHVLKVQGYSETKGVGIARRLKSNPFVVGGHTWCVSYFPDGVTEDDADWVAFALRLEGRRPGSRRDDDVVVRATFSLLDAGRGPVPSHAVSSGVWTFSRIGQSCSHPRFIERTELESTYVKDDGFLVKCDVALLSSPSAAAASPPPPEDLCRHLGDLLASGAGADVTLEVGGETFPAHKNVLAARSPVFRAEFFGGEEYMETDASRVSIHGVEPGVFGALLQFIYTDSLPAIHAGDVTAMAQHLLVAADRYGIERLKSICEYVLCTFVDTKAVVTTLVLAEQHGCEKLKEACVEVLKSSAKYEELVVGEDFEYLASTCPSLLQELRGGEICEDVDLEHSMFDDC